MKRTLWAIAGILVATLIASLVATIGLGLSLNEFIGIAMSLTIAGAALWKVPRWQVAGLHGKGITPDKIAELENSARDTLAKILGGAFFLGTLFFTWQNLQIERHKETASEKGQITERFSRAVDQLGSNDHNVRVGAIYTLEQVADASPHDYQWTVTEILAAFVRQQAPLKNEQRTAVRRCDEIRPRGTPVKQPEVDIQAALEVIGRRQLEYTPPLYGQPRAVDLRHTDLRGANLSTANLEYAAFTDSNLEAASIASANLKHATLRGVNLVCTYMPRSDFEGADLNDAHVEGAAFAESERLSDAVGVTCDQIRSAHSDSSTVLPSYLKERNCFKSTPQAFAAPNRGR